MCYPIGMPDQKADPYQNPKGMTDLVGVGPLTSLPSGNPFLESAVLLWCEVDPKATVQEVVNNAAFIGPEVLVQIVLHDGRPEVDEVKVSRRPGDPEIANEMLREIPLNRIVERGLDQMESWARRVWAETSPDSPGPVGPESRHPHPYFAPFEAVETRRRRSITDKHLREVAAVYNADTTGTPTKAVREQIPTSPRNAARWVALAKKKGFINQTEDQS